VRQPRGAWGALAATPTGRQSPDGGEAGSREVAACSLLVLQCPPSATGEAEFRDGTREEFLAFNDIMGF
jgi:hypothetical protein